MIMFHIKNVGIFSHVAFCLFFFTKKTFQSKTTNLTSYMHFFNFLDDYSI